MSLNEKAFNSMILVLFDVDLLDKFEDEPAAANKPGQNLDPIGRSHLLPWPCELLLPDALA
jgi:hypothetical protein